MADVESDRNDEETPLLSSGLRPQPTPLPMGQILLLLLAQLTEPITSQSILPYINEVRFTGSCIFPAISQSLD
jgi:hypothetical protein